MLNSKARFIQIINTASALAKTGADVKLLTGGSLNADALLNHYGLSKHPLLEVVFLPMIRKDEGAGVSIGMVFHAALVIYLARKRKDDGIIFVRHIKTARALMRFRMFCRMPVVFEAHEIFHLTTEKIRKRRRIYQHEADVYRACGAVVAITESLRTDLVKIFSLDGIPSVTIPDAVRGDMLTTAVPYEQRKFIFYVGGLYSYKGVDLLIKAMAALPDETLVIAGGGQRLDELRQMAFSMGLSARITFTGQLRHSDVCTYLKQAKIAVIPNLKESVSMYSSPLKMFEYMASNIPIVAADIPGIREVLTDGKTAVFFTPGDVQSLRAALKTLIERPEKAKEIAVAAHTLSKRFTYEHRAQRIIDFLSDTFYN
ncbi:MAG: glycosyltransferase family 4 protein [Candidatus Magnetominusculus sp. LBB02]|nr:glycosyltransferase family 4 protein [Candidatus Magnetominusculus sp. LBB02]